MNYTGTKPQNTKKKPETTLLKPSQLFYAENC